MGTYIPHTDDEVASMLAFLGLSSVGQLFDVVPEALRLQRGLELADGRRGARRPGGHGGVRRAQPSPSDRLVCFAGGGAYDHEIPSVTRALAGRSEFVTSYTPYQPEVAQGVLQAVFEYQTMVARLAGLPVANASLYDGGSAAVEAVNLGVAASGRNTGLGVGRRPSPLAPDAGHLRRRHRAPAADHPPGRRRHRLARAGTTPTRSRPAWCWSGYPNYLGCIEDLARARALCDRTGALLVVGIDPVAAGILSSAGEWGADVVVGEGQVFGTTLGFGGPYLGLFACAQAHVRRLPGRLVGETVDVEGRRAYVTTLRAREQDIRREKATSNVCTNQTLMAVTAAIQLGWLGTSGLAELALRCAQATRYARDALLAVDGVEPYAAAPVLREFALRLPVPATVVVERMADAGFLAGIPLGDDFDGGDHGLLVAVTERRTRDEIDAYVTAMAKAVA